MVDHPVDHLLPEWGRWARRENNPGLRHSQVQYTEYIARAHSATGWADFDPRIAVLDEIIRNRLAYTPRRMIVLRYVHGLPDKKAAQLLSLSRQELNRMRQVVVLPQLRHLWDATCTDKTVVDET